MRQYKPSSEVVSTKIDDDECVLLSLDTQQYYSLNETGSRIWELLSEGYGPEAIASAITNEWTTTPEDALTHVQSFLRKLCDEGLVKEGDETDA